MQSSRRTPALVRAAVPALVAAMLAPAPSHAQTAAASAPEAAWPLPRLSGPIRVDGRSDDPAWRAIAPLPLTQYLPRFGAPPSEATEIRVAYDDDALYAVFDIREAHPGGVRASTMVRDDDAPGDFVNLVLDTFLDGLTGVAFSTTPGGNRNDWAISDDLIGIQSVNRAWDIPWELATRRDAGGWHAEMRIPFEGLRLVVREGRVELGLSVNRLSAHNGERVVFPAIEPTAAFAVFKPSRMQRVVLDGIRPRRFARLTPYLLAGRAGAREPDPLASPWTRDHRVEAGADLKLALSPHLTLDLTANTDFAEAEVDDARVNLTRYPLLYPEQRAFFQERSGLFEVRTGAADLLFHSRRMGLRPDGTPVRILGGARLVGRTAGWDVGLLDVQTARGSGAAAENLGVLRLKRTIVNARSSLGLMATGRLSADSAQAALGADLLLHLGGDDYLTAAGAGVLGDAPALAPGSGTAPRAATRVQLERRRNEGLWYRAAAATTGSRYVPALGYVERGNVVRADADLGVGRVVSGGGDRLRASLAGIRAWHNASGAVESGSLGATLAWETPSGAVWSLQAGRQEDRLERPFAPAPGATVPAGRHTARSVRLALEPSNGPRAVVGASLRAGEYFDGTLLTARIAPEWRASAHLRILGELQVDRLRFAARDQTVTARLARLRIVGSASPKLSLVAVVQTVSLDDLVTAHLRVRYNVREGHDLWVVLGQTMHLDRDRVVPAAPAVARASLLVKYARSFGG